MRPFSKIAIHDDDVNNDDDEHAIEDTGDEFCHEIWGYEYIIEYSTDTDDGCEEHIEVECNDEMILYCSDTDADDGDSDVDEIIDCCSDTDVADFIEYCSDTDGEESTVVVGPASVVLSN